MKWLASLVKISDWIIKTCPFPNVCGLSSWLFKNPANTSSHLIKMQTKGSCHLPPEQTAMPGKGVEPVELPRQPEACWDAELTVPASLIFHFLNHSPIGTTLRSVSISSQTSPLGLLPFLPLVPKAVLWVCFPPASSSRRSCRTEAKTSWVPHTWEWEFRLLKGLRSRRRQGRGWARQTVDWERQATHSTLMTWTKQQSQESREREAHGCRVS